MAFSAYATSLRGDMGRALPGRALDDGVPCFVPQLSKVKTNVMCQANNQHLLFCFEKAGGADGDAATLAGASYRQQGNHDLYSAENLVERHRLLDDTQVVAALGRFWETFPHIRQGGQSLERRDYVDVFMKFYKALVAPSEFSMAEARRIVERDWQRDMGAVDAMTRSVFFRALFEVADIWTVGIGADVYASFLNKLYDRVTMKVYDKEKCVWLTVFADIDKIRPFDAEPTPDASASLLQSPDISVTSSVAPTGDMTNQDVAVFAVSPETPVSSGLAILSSGAASASGYNTKPPLLKKKTMSVPSGLGSPTKASAISILSSIEHMGGSLRRLPDLQATASGASDTIRTLHQGIANRAPLSPTSQLTDVASSRSDGGGDSPSTAFHAGGDSSLDRNSMGGHRAKGPPTKAAKQSAANTRLSTSPKKSGQSSTTTRRDSTAAAAAAQMPKSRNEDDAEPASVASAAPSVPDVPPQQVRFTMPSIYLSPEITSVHSGEKAARRRVRESMKLAQRLRRITF